MPLKEVLDCNGFGRKESFEEEEGEVTERFNIVFPRSLMFYLMNSNCVVVADKMRIG